MRYLHTMLRVRNLDDALDFYCNKLGLKETRRRVDEKNRYTLVFLAAPEDETLVEASKKSGRPGPEVELTYNWDTDHYNLGNGYGHVALEVDNVYQACEDIRQRGGKIIRDAGPMNAGTTIIAFVEDPDGYPIELIGKKS